MRKLFKTIFRKLGLDINRCDPTKVWFDVADTPHGRRSAILKENSIDLVLDVGAHKGWYSADLRAFGYTGRIISFEPQLVPFQELEKRSCDDPLWKVSRNALGDIDDTVILHVSGSPESSSLLNILPAHTEALTNSKVIGEEEISVSRLDSIFDQYCNPSDRVFLKMDVQGFEKKSSQGLTYAWIGFWASRWKCPSNPCTTGRPFFMSFTMSFWTRGSSWSGRSRLSETRRAASCCSLMRIFIR